MRLILVVIFFHCACTAMELDQSLNTFHGEAITAESLARLAAPPADERAKIDTLIAAHRHTFDSLVAPFASSTYFERYRLSNALLVGNLGVQNMSRANYIFRAPTDEELFVQIAGPYSRVGNLMAYYGYKHEKIWDQLGPYRLNGQKYQSET